MGKFADLIKKDADWDTQTPKEISDQWFIYISPLESTDALIGAPEDSKQRKVYAEAEKVVNKLTNLAITHCDKPNQTAIECKRAVTALVDKLDQQAALIENFGNLYLRELECDRIFRGDWTPVADASIPAAHSQDCNTYNLKHFGADPKAARYLGPFDKNYKAVKGLEEKAIAHGLDVPGSAIFRFNSRLGWDGQTDAQGTINTNCIRVDSIGSKQHSHPFPETGTEYVSHQKLVCSAICDAVEKNDLEALLSIAKYLTTIGADRGEYTMPGNALKQRLKTALKKEGASLPSCKFWGE